MASKTLNQSAIEAVLPDNHDDLRTVLAHTPFLLCRCNSDFRYVFVSESYARKVGRRPDEIVGHPIVEILGEEGFQTIRPHVEKALRGEHVEYESEVHIAGVGLRNYHIMYTPEKDAFGEVKGWIASIIDISAEKTAQRTMDAALQAMTLLQQLGAELTRQGLRLEDCLQNILDAAISLTRADKGNLQLFDFTTNALRIAAHRGFGEPFLKSFGEVRDAATTCAAALKSGEQVIVEDILASKIFDGQLTQQALLEEGARAVISTPLKSSDGVILGMISTYFKAPRRPTDRDLRFIDLLARQSADYLQRKRSEALEKTLIGELQHRTKNLLAVVQGIASAMPKIDPENFQERFRDRLAGLATSLDLLVKSQWQGVDISSLIRAQLAHLRELIGPRITLTGPPVRLSDGAAQAIGMVVHELATNASKYGALCGNVGHVSITWDLTASSKDRLTLSWVEIGGPTVGIPGARGFGTFVITELPTFQLDANVDVDYRPSGLKWQLSCPAASVLHTGEGK
jgi:PAS domain S-box-containing protein